MAYEDVFYRALPDSVDGQVSSLVPPSAAAGVPYQRRISLRREIL